MNIIMLTTFVWSVYEIKSDEVSWKKSLAIIALIISGPYLLGVLLSN